MSKETDYGILLLAHFAEVPEELMFSARELAAETQVPLPMVSKILKMLSRQGLLVSQRGAKGGYTLARQASEISIVEVINAMEGSLALTECIDSPGDCRQESVCLVRRNWAKINERVLRALEGISVAEMAAPPSQQLIALDSNQPRIS